MSPDVTRFIIVSHIELKQITNSDRIINVNYDLEQNQSWNYQGAVWTPNGVTDRFLDYSREVSLTHTCFPTTKWCVYLYFCTSRLQRTCTIRKGYILSNLFNLTVLIFHYTFNHISKDIPGQTHDPSVNLIMRLDTFHNHGGILKGQRSVEQRSETKDSHVNQARCPRGEAHVWSRQFKRLENQRRVNYTPCKFWWMHRRGAGRLQRKTNGEISQTQYYLHFKVCWGTRGDREDAAALIHFTLTEICIRVQEQIKTAWTDKNSPNVLVICIADVLRSVESWPRRGLWLLKPLSFFLKCVIISAFLHFWHLGSTWRRLLCIRGKIK